MYSNYKKRIKYIPTTSYIKKVSNSFSNYQRTKEGLLPKYYNEVDVKIILNKINQIKGNFSSFNFTKKKLACKMLKQYNKNINFIVSMLNQQNIERA